MRDWEEKGDFSSVRLIKTKIKMFVLLFSNYDYYYYFIEAKEI